MQCVAGHVWPRVQDWILYEESVLCCCVLENNNEVGGGWQVLFEAGPPQSVIGLTATCIPSLASANT